MPDSRNGFKMIRSLRIGDTYAIGRSVEAIAAATERLKGEGVPVDPVDPVESLKKAMGWLRLACAESWRLKEGPDMHPDAMSRVVFVVPRQGPIMAFYGQKAGQLVERLELIAAKSGVFSDPVWKIPDIADFSGAAGMTVFGSIDGACGFWLPLTPFYVEVDILREVYPDQQNGAENG